MKQETLNSIYAGKIVGIERIEKTCCHERKVPVVFLGAQKPAENERKREKMEKKKRKKELEFVNVGSVVLYVGYALLLQIPRV